MRNAIRCRRSGTRRSAMRLFSEEIGMGTHPATMKGQEPGHPEATSEADASRNPGPRSPELPLFVRAPGPIVIRLRFGALPRTTPDRSSPLRLVHQFPIAVPRERDAFRARTPVRFVGFRPGVQRHTLPQSTASGAVPGLGPHGNPDVRRSRIPTPHRFTPAQSPRCPCGNGLYRIGFEDYRLSRPVFSSRRRRRVSSVGRSAGQP